MPTGICPSDKSEENFLTLFDAWKIAKKDKNQKLTEYLKPPPEVTPVPRWLWVSVVVLVLLDLITLKLGGVTINTIGPLIVLTLIAAILANWIRNQLKDNKICSERRIQWSQMLYCPKHQIAFEKDGSWNIKVDMLHTYFQPKVDAGYDLKD